MNPLVTVGLVWAIGFFMGAVCSYISHRIGANENKIIKYMPPKFDVMKTVAYTYFLGFANPKGSGSTIVNTTFRINDITHIKTLQEELEAKEEIEVPIIITSITLLEEYYA